MIITNITRDDIPKMLKSGGTAVELGVCKGHYSNIILRNSSISLLYSIDRWAGDRGHDDKEFIRACEILSPYKQRSIVWRKTFDQAHNAFIASGTTFDFVYLDGYAHLGQESVEHFYKCYDLLNEGRIFAGHDYDKSFPKNIENVDKFLDSKKLPMFLTKEKTYPSFFTWKR